jgi:hypothetical protein
MVWALTVKEGDTATLHLMGPLLSLHILPLLPECVGLGLPVFASFHLVWFRKAERDSWIARYLDSWIFGLQDKA